MFLRLSPPAHDEARDSSGAALEPSSEVRLLGKQLYARRAEVVPRTIERSRDSGVFLDDAVEERFERVGEVSTIAVAKWMAGESPEAAIEVGQEVWQIFGQLAAQRAAPLNEVTKRCWRWHDAVSELLRTSARSSSSHHKRSRKRWRCSSDHCA